MSKTMRILIWALVTIAVFVFMERAQRRLLVKYPKRQVGNQVQSVDPSHTPSAQLRLQQSVASEQGSSLV